MNELKTLKSVVYMDRDWQKINLEKYKLVTLCPFTP